MTNGARETITATAAAPVTRPRSTRRRWSAVPLATVLLVMVWANPAAADPAGPTDYRTDVIGIEPLTPVIDVDSIGGDSFIRLTVEPGHEVEVVGYQGEPYLRFRADGVVEQNDNSPSRWLNDDRYGEAVAPAGAGAEAEPAWIVVSTDGSYSWHDHRAHWMNPRKPPGAEPGDTVLEAVVPLLVDGTEVDVTVRSVLLEPPSPLGPVTGAIAGLLTAAIGWQAGRLFGVTVIALLWTAGALVVGLLAYSAVPAETEPSMLIWLLPLIGLGLLTAAGVLRSRGRPWEIWSILTLAGGVELVLWAWLRRTGLTRALIPTMAPYWLDRIAVAAAAVVGITAIGLVVGQMARPAGTTVTTE